MSEITKYLESYFSLEGVRAAGTGGSRASGMGDENSDYDIYIFTDRVPEPEERLKLVKRLSGRYEIYGDYFGPGDEFLVDEINREFDLMYFDAGDFEKHVKSVWLECRASNAYTTCFLYTLKNLRIEYDPEGFIAELKRIIDTPYPEGLRENIIKRTFMLMKDKPFSSYLEQIEKALERKDLNSISHRRSAFMESYFDALFAINRLLHPGEKRLISYALENCSALPEDFEEDMKKALNCNGSELPGILSGMAEKLRKII
ncbi:MAG: hypothetical protein K5634_05955 [Sphaerochaetaceae bacterium]|nr:hypothetical protein [Sphaerochaetaceae bacterium]